MLRRGVPPTNHVRRADSAHIDSAGSRVPSGDLAGGKTQVNGSAPSCEGDVIHSFAGPATSSESGMPLLVASVLLSVWVLSGLIANFLLGEELKRKRLRGRSRRQARSAGEAINALRRKPSP